MARRWKRIVGWTACGAVLVCGVVEAVSSAGRLPESDAEATAVVAQWVPAGTPVDEARRILEDHGFETALYPANSQFNKGPNDLLWGDRHQSEGWPVVRRHQVMLDVADGRVGPVRVASGLVGP